MPSYMTQTMSSGTLPTKLYYREQTQEHVSHAESSRFSHDAKQNYATFNHIAVEIVVEGRYRSGQGVPTADNSFNI